MLQSFAAVPGRLYVVATLLPLAAFVSSPHVLAYDAVTWLASAWLLLQFAGEVPRLRRSVVVLLMVGWWGGNLAAFPEVNAIAPWGAFGAVICLVGMVWLYHQAIPPHVNAGLARPPFGSIPGSGTTNVC